MLMYVPCSFLEQRSIPLSGRPGQYGSGAGDSSDGGGVAGCVALAVDPAGAILVAEGPSAADRVAVWHVEVMGGSASMVQVGRGGGHVGRHVGRAMDPPSGGSASSRAAVY